LSLLDAPVSENGAVCFVMPPYVIFSSFRFCVRLIFLLWRDFSIFIFFGFNFFAENRFFAILKKLIFLIGLENRPRRILAEFFEKKPTGLVFWLFFWVSGRFLVLRKRERMNSAGFPIV
jgi:hypothetical protein